MNRDKFIRHLLVCVLPAVALTGCYKFTKERLSGTDPIAEMNLTRLNGKPYELSIRLKPRIRIDSVVDISYFDGLTYRMNLDAAKQRFGEPQNVHTQSDMRLPVSLYPVLKGQIGFMTVPTSAGAPPQPQVWAYPSNQSPVAIILDDSLRAQVLRHLPADLPIRVHVLSDGARGSLTLSMSSNRVDYLILGPRDGE